MKKYFYIFLLVFSFIIYDKVYALDNYNTNYNVVVNEYDFSQVNIDNSNNITKLDFINNLINLNSDYYNIFVYTELFNNYSSDNYGFYVFLYPKSLEYLESSVYGSGDFLYLSLKSSTFYYYFPITNDIYNTSNYNNFINCYINNTSCSSTLQRPNLGIARYNSSMNNNNSYNLFVPPTNLNGGYWFVTYPIYSSIPIKIINDVTGNSLFYKNLIINDVQYDINSYFPTYYDLYLNDNANNIDIDKTLDNFNILGSFYFRLNKLDISNFSFSYEFDPVLTLLSNINNPTYFDDFYDDLSTEISFFGRKYDSTNNYYTYDSIDCSLSYGYTKNTSTITLQGNNLSCSSNLNDYDYLFIYINQFLKSSDTIPNVIFKDIQVNNALYHYGTDYNGYIYDVFKNLPSNFKMSFSSNYIDSALVTSTINYGAFAESLSTTDNESYIPMAQKEFPFRLGYGYAYSRYYVLYGDSTIFSGTRDIEVFIGDSTIISFNNLDNSNDFYLYNENKQITLTTANVRYEVNNSNNKFDLNYYFKQVNSYISNLSLDITNFANITQNFYDNLPSFLQLFILVMFILTCFYIIFRLIKK